MDERQHFDVRAELANMQKRIDERRSAQVELDPVGDLIRMRMTVSLVRGGMPEEQANVIVRQEPFDTLVQLAKAHGGDTALKRFGLLH